MSRIITLEDLTQAIQNSPDNKGMEEDQAYELALRVLNFFGYSDRIIDNVLEPEDRDAFYMLEDSGVLTTEREEITLYDGREWRIHYWLFRNDRIEELIKNEKPETEDEVVEEKDIYKELPREAWFRHVEEKE